MDELLGALRELAGGGLSMIVVEHEPKKILPFIDHAIVLDWGAIAHEAASAELVANPAALDAHLTATRKAWGNRNDADDRPKTSTLLLIDFQARLASAIEGAAAAIAMRDVSSRRRS